METFIWSIPGMLWRYVARLRAARNRILTERLLDSLPPDLRKDIGWPDRYLDAERVESSGQPTVPATRQRHSAAPLVVPFLLSGKRGSVPVLPTRKSPVSS